MSSTGTNTSNSTAKFEPPAMTTDGSLGPGTTWQEYLQRGGEIASKYGSDTGLIYGNSPNQPMVAQMSQLQNTAANGIYGIASQGGQNEGTSNAYLNDMLQGKFQNVQPDNPYLGAMSSYGGNSPQFESMVNASNQNITDAYNRGTAAQTDASAARQRAYGGSAYDELKSAQARDLTGAVAQNTNNLRNDQYNRSAGLEQADIGRNSGLAQQGIQNAWQGYENAAGRGLQAVGGVQQQGQTDLQRWLATMGVGDLQRDVQSENIAAAKDLFNQNVQQPLQALDVYGNVLSRASGQGGSSTSSQFGGGQNGLMNALGGGAALYGLLGK